MKFTKQFAYANKRHMISFIVSFNDPIIELDGMQYKNVLNLTRFGVLHFESTVLIDGDELEVCVYRKQIYVFKDDIDVETGMHKNEKNHLNRFWKFLSWLCYVPICVLFFLVYSDSSFNIDKNTRSNSETVILVIVLLAVMAICVTGKKWCNYFEWQPINRNLRPQNGIALSVFLSVTFSSLVMVIANCFLLT